MSRPLDSRSVLICTLPHAQQYARPAPATSQLVRQGRQVKGLGGRAAVTRPGRTRRQGSRTPCGALRRGWCSLPAPSSPHGHHTARTVMHCDVRLPCTCAGTVPRVAWVAPRDQCWSARRHTHSSMLAVLGLLPLCLSWSLREGRWGGKTFLLQRPGLAAPADTAAGPRAVHSAGVRARLCWTGWPSSQCPAVLRAIRQHALCPHQLCAAAAVRGSRAGGPSSRSGRRL